MIRKRDTLDTKLHIRVNKKELEGWQQLAKTLGVDLSELIREGARLIARRESQRLERETK